MQKTINLEFDFRSFSSASKGLLPNLTPTNNSFNFQPLDLLMMIGRLTTPTPQYPWDFRTFYAILRYGWAISGDLSFRLDRNVRNIDFRLKTLMSEDFGVGFAGLVMRDFFNCDFAGSIPTIFHNRARRIALNSRATPDFIGLRRNGTLLIFESKGTQTSMQHSDRQIGSGKNNQVIPFQKNFLNLPGFVVGSYLSREELKIGSRIKVVDPYGNKKPFDDQDSRKYWGSILDSHYYRVVTFISGVPWPSKEWREYSIEELLRSSDNIKLDESGGWWYREVVIPNIPILSWVSKKAKAFSIKVGISSKAIELFKKEKWGDILKMGEEGWDFNSFLENVVYKRGHELVRKIQYKDGMIASMSLIFD